ncbi:MAG: S41 family peptidase [Myxococcota bacterium]
MRLGDFIAAQDNPDVNDWVVDLRNNTGGNMWPMIAGLGPLFDNELLGHFIDADGVATPWGYVRGSAVIDGTSRVSVNTPYVLENRPRRIAVLSSRRVASSGEATLIAFKKQSNVRIFGSDSCGLSTANTAFPLSNGTTLFLTTAITADREQEAYGGTVRVDEMTDPGSTLAEAFRWLEANP